MIAVLSLTAIFLLLILNTFFDFGGSYIGIFIYIVMPVVLILGLLLIPIGMRINAKKARRAMEAGQPMGWPVLDFNNVGTRNASIIFIFGSIVLLIMSSIGSYQAFHITESVEFCGKLCHQVMEPEYTTYHGSSHERVACVECHVGNGASWYVKSKLSGLYQVYSVIAKKYPTPIPTPISNLRPARETCEHCHWPEKFYDWKLKTRHTFLADEGNTAQIINLLVKTSSKTTSGGFEKGIHQHINPDIRIEYKAADAQRQVIPWVKYTNLKTGETEIFTDNASPMEQSKIDSMETRVMDCLDCHNRPSHDYRSPQNFVDKSLSDGKISSSLPEIKSVAMQVLYKTYSTKDSAMNAIREGIADFYESGYPEIFAARQGDIEAAITELQNDFANNIFPFMKASWRAYPNNISHIESDGCFRCHNDRHATAQGKVISKDCNLCHNILAQGTTGNMSHSDAFSPLEFRHPVDIGEDWKTEMCSTCHAQLY